MKNFNIGTNRQESNEMQQEHLVHPSNVEENVGDEMVEDNVGDDLMTPQSDDDLDFDEPEEDFDDRQLWDYFHPLCGYGMHPTRIGPFQYGGIRGNALEVQHIDAGKTYHGYTRYPELREEWVEPGHATPLGFTEADFALHFGPRPGVKEDELGDNFIDDLRLSETVRLPDGSRNARALDQHEAISPTQDVAPPASTPRNRPHYLPEAPVPRPSYTPRALFAQSDPRALRQSRRISQRRRMRGLIGSGRNDRGRDPDPFDLRNPFPDNNNVDDIGNYSYGSDSEEAGGTGRMSLYRSRSSSRAMRAMDRAGSDGQEWSSSRIPYHVLAYNSFYGTGR